MVCLFCLALCELTIRIIESLIEEEVTFVASLVVMNFLITLRPELISRPAVCESSIKKGIICLCIIGIRLLSIVANMLFKYVIIEFMS